MVIILIVVVVIVLLFLFTPYPGSMIIKAAFDRDHGIQDIELYDHLSKEIEVIKDITYPSQFQKNQLDIYVPQAVNESLPVVFWIHGGGYVGGDKHLMREFAVYLAHMARVIVVTVNYQLAPSLQYPGQLQQVDEAYRFMVENKSQYPFCDLDRVFFGGDSAGGQIAAQYVLVQTNEDYARDLSMTRSVPSDSLLGMISYCGPLDLSQMANEQSSNLAMDLFMRTVAWSILGERKLKEHPLLTETSLVGHLNQDFVPSYVTDGNSLSFASQGIAFAQRLEELQVPVKTLFFEDVNDVIAHEYQFNFKTKEGQKNLENTIKFIKENIERKIS